MQLYDDPASTTCRSIMMLAAEEGIGIDYRPVALMKVTIADYFGAELVALGELIRCEFQDYPNVRRWMGNMKALECWPEVQRVFDGFAATLKDKGFDSIWFRAKRRGTC